MSANQPGSSLYKAFKQDIQAGRLPVGTPLKQTELAQRYGVSRIPVRDAIKQLMAEGWLAQHGKRGVMIPPLDPTEAEDLYLMRMYLEPLILTHAIPHLSHQTLGQAQDLLQQLDDTTLDPHQHGALNWSFHALLYQAAQRPVLYQTIADLHRQCARYIGYQSLTLDYLHTSQAEHHDLLDAIRDKNTRLAKSILKQHISEAGEQLVAYLRGLSDTVAQP
ncbi:GntR family transcriptional regulator [Aestuariibacter halophilus]|uniref:GntR family transcriptional regulator n=1 Tax=Fluctibacter halophilus TaxID=226011 RepID=A0ABS8GCL0_9ALTE|nr:GntR family transcriptional regulator [Aestuariibacter halophilus]MCC2618139.1 GntR family transcriptional regulator [Aestuariibacter halophilus]